MGRVLLAEPFMLDPNFKRSVVMLCEHQDDGTVGFILNKTLELTLPDAIPELPDFKVPIYFGGPVEPDTLHFFHKIETLEGCQEVMDGVYWGGNFEMLKIIIESGNISPRDIRFFLGYAGWGSGQLTEEMKEKSWIVSEGEDQYSNGYSK